MLVDFENIFWSNILLKLLTRVGSKFLFLWLLNPWTKLPLYYRLWAGLRGEPFLQKIGLLLRKIARFARGPIPCSLLLFLRGLCRRNLRWYSLRRLFGFLSSFRRLGFLRFRLRLIGRLSRRRICRPGGIWRWFCSGRGFGCLLGGLGCRKCFN